MVVAFLSSEANGLRWARAARKGDNPAVITAQDEMPPEYSEEGALHGVTWLHWGIDDLPADKVYKHL